MGCGEKSSSFRKSKVDVCIKIHCILLHKIWSISTIKSNQVLYEVVKQLDYLTKYEKDFFYIINNSLILVVMITSLH